jgi:tellurite methyltransferase
VDVREPSRILTEAIPWLPDPGRALDLACGAGRNALFLAEKGWRVVGVDLSVEGLRRMGRKAGEEGLPVLPVLADAGDFLVRPGSFDLVINTFFLLREAFPLVREALRPGGLLVFETFSVIELEELGGDIRRAFTLERGELLEAFGDLDVLLHEEGLFQRDEGERGLARLIARKRG